MRPFTLLLLCAVFSCSGQDRKVALTFDDLPAADATQPREAEQINSSIVQALHRYHAPAVGFVNEQKVERLGSNALKLWRKGAISLGNHTYSHPDLNQLTTDEFEAEVIRGEASLGAHPRWFRFPFNHAGDTPDKQAFVASFLASRGYQIATCTIENEDYEWSRAYDQIADKNSEQARRARAEYVRYTGTKIDYYAALHKQIFGREIPLVMLLHANHLNASTMLELLQTFAAKQYRFVTLDEAQSDLAYRTPTPQATAYGPMWGYRWAQALGIKVDGSREPDVPAWVRQFRK